MAISFLSFFHSFSTESCLQKDFHYVKMFLQIMQKRTITMQTLLPLDDIREALQDRRLTVVAEKCGLSHPTVKGIASGDGVDHISLTTWKKLSQYLTESA
jgi:hypothetical protein